MNNLYTSKKSIEYSNEGKLEEQMHMFLNNEGNNPDLSKGLKIEKTYYFEPVKMPLLLFSRCCGPEEGLKYKIDETIVLKL